MGLSYCMRFSGSEARHPFWGQVKGKARYRIYSEGIPILRHAQVYQRLVASLPLTPLTKMMNERFKLLG